MKRTTTFYAILTSLLMTALACKLPGSATSPTPDIAALVAQTQTAIAVSLKVTPAVPSQQAGQPPTTPVVSPSTPTALPAPPSGSVTPAATRCTDKAKFISETIPDNSQVPPNGQFMKTWTLQNAGTCTWTPAYELVFIKGEQMGGSSPAPIGQNVPPNGTIQVYLPQTAPSVPGQHEVTGCCTTRLREKPSAWEIRRM